MSQIIDIIGKHFPSSIVTNNKLARLHFSTWWITGRIPQSSDKMINLPIPLFVNRAFTGCLDFIRRKTKKEQSASLAIMTACDVVALLIAREKNSFDKRSASSLLSVVHRVITVLV